MSGFTRTRRIGWKALVGIALVPLTIAGLFIWGLWNPTDRLRTVEAAVVNLDQPVTIDGQYTPLGRVFAGALIGDSTVSDDATNFKWQLTNENDAEEGLAEGRYSTVVTIPENFSEAATSGGDPATAEQATIDIQTSDRGRLIDSALSNVVTSTATRVLNEQLGTAFIDQVFVGMGTLHTSLGDAASGAELLADGSRQLATGTSGIATGAGELARGTAQLATGTGALATGASELSTGATGIATGVSGLVAGLNEYSASGQELAGLAQQAAAGTAQYTGGVSMFSGEINAQVQQLNGAIGAAGECAASGASAEFCENYKVITDTMPDLNVSAYSLGLVAGGGADLAGGWTGLADGFGAYANGAGQIAVESAPLVDGANQLASGTAAFATGAQQLAAGTPALASGTAQLAEGAAQLAEGAEQAASGTGELASGLGQAVDGVPNYDKSERESLALSALAPVVATGSGDELFNAAGVPLFTGIALWAGGLAIFLMCSPLWRRTREAARGLGAITMRSALPGLLGGAVQGALVGIAMPIALSLEGAQFAGFLGLGVLAGVSFALLNQGLAALLGGLGRFLSFIMLVLAFAGGIVSTAPAALRALGDATPIGSAFAGFQAIASGASGAGGAAMQLVLWGLVGLALTAFAAARVRKADRVPAGTPVAPALQRELQPA